MNNVMLAQLMKDMQVRFAEGEAFANSLDA
jgi:hypothetical protein